MFNNNGEGKSGRSFSDSIASSQYYAPVVGSIATTSFLRLRWKSRVKIINSIEVVGIAGVQVLRSQLVGFERSETRRMIVRSAG
jgi:hypothetical protein